MNRKDTVTFPPALRAVENSAQERWRRENCFTAYKNSENPTSKYFVTTPMPYTDSLMTLNRGYTLTMLDIVANYQQMKGKNLLFSIFFHYGGTRIPV